MNFPFPHGFISGGPRTDPNVWNALNDVVGVPVTWSPTDKNAKLTLSNGNLTVSSADLVYHKMIRATNPIIPSAGKAYWEFIVSSQGTTANGYITILGQSIGGMSVADGQYLSLGGQACGQGYATDGANSYLNGWTGSGGIGINSATFACAYDSIAGKFWIGSGLTWAAGGNPFAGTGQTFSRSAAAAPMFPALSFANAPTVTAVFDVPSFNSPLCSIVGPRQGDAFTKMLLHCDGKNGNIAVPDRSASAHLMGGYNFSVSSAASKFGNGSVAFAGSSYLYCQDTISDYTFGTGDFTIDLWVRLNANGTGVIFDWQPGGAGNYPTLFLSSGTLLYYVNSATRITGTTILAINTWYHIALARSGTNTKLFLNGVQEGSTFVDSTNYVASRAFFGIWGSDATTWPLNGYLDEIRISKGIARWTANFTPPTAAYT